MANFDMRGQHITNQYNAGRAIHFGAVESSLDLMVFIARKGDVRGGQGNG